MSRFRAMGLVLLVAASVSGCKMTLYSNIAEIEANQMLALLMLRQIPADKEIEKGGTVTLRVDQRHFINAVEVLRQNGFPHHKRLGIEDLFPSNQLVTSPTQERAKMQLLKEQQLESMISAMDGVIGAKVSIAQKMDENGKPAGKPSAAVFIKYSPQTNLSNYEVQIRSLVRDGIPDITSDQISVVMQAADFRYEGPVAQEPPSRWRIWLQEKPGVAAASAAGVVLLLSVMGGLAAWLVRSRRRSDAPA